MAETQAPEVGMCICCGVPRKLWRFCGCRCPKRSRAAQRHL